MDVLTRDALKSLIQDPSDVCVSVYLPTHRAGIEAHQQDPVRFKNHLREAEDQLKALGLRPPEAEAVLQPGLDLLDDSAFWASLEDGLAVFLSKGQFSYYRVPVALPDLVVVGFDYHIKPLLPLVSGDGVFYVLALSQSQNCLLRCTRYSVREVDLATVPSSLAEALRYDEDDPQRPWHQRSMIRAGGERGAMFHGHGAGPDDGKHKGDIKRYFQKVDEGLREFLRDSTAPLVLAAVEYLHPIYADASSYAHLVPQGVVGNPDEVNNRDLHQRAWPLVEPRFKAARQQAVDRYRQYQGQGSPLASDDVPAIVAAAHQSKVEVLWVPVGSQVWGSYDPTTHTAHVRAEKTTGDEDLLNLAAAQTYVNGGVVYAGPPVELPDGGLAAIFRY